MFESVPMQIVMIMVAIIGSQWVAWKLHTPAITFLLATGFFLGPVTDIIQPELLMGDLLRPFIAAAVSIILFEGSLQLHFSELRETKKAIRHVIILGAPIGWLLISLAAHYIAGLEWAVAITLGGILIVTGPTVIMPMLRQARLTSRTGNILKWEGIVNDPVGIILAILSYEYFVASSHNDVGILFYAQHFFSILLVSSVSFVLAHIIKAIFEHGHIPEYLKTPFLLSFVVSLFFLCDSILHESGLIAVTILGLTLANINTPSLENIKRFKETITIMLVSSVFILLTANLNVSILSNLSWQGILFVVALLFIIRPLTFWICSIGTEMSRNEVILTGLIAPRGVVCAAMAGIIGPLLVKAGFEDGAKILPIAFAVVIISVVLHSLMIKPLAKKLNLTSGETNGLMIVGSYSWSIQLAKVLKTRNVPVIIIDNNWFSLGKARLAGLPVYYGELLSEETEFTLEFNKYNTLIATTTNPAYNALVCEKFGHEYGSERMFRLACDNNDVSERKKMSSSVQGKRLFSDNLSLTDIQEKFVNGWIFKVTRIGRVDKNSPLIIPELNENRFYVCLISKNGLLKFYSSDQSSKITPKEDDYIVLMEKETKPVEKEPCNEMVIPPKNE